MAANENYVYGANKKYFDTESLTFVKSFTNYLKQIIRNTSKKYKEIIVLCIGTDRSTGDSFAPIIGTILSKKKNLPYKILGTLENPVHAKNLNEILDKIDKQNSLIIAIDACLGDVDNIGKIKVSEGGLKPGSGVGKEHLPIVGDISIAGIVNSGGYIDFLVLQNTRLGIVYKMSELTSIALNEAICQANKVSVLDKLLQSVNNFANKLKVRLVLD